ncbi:polysaccharide pyruvyl transferase family protein [Microbacterium sp. A204]|uniref:polysaccharide pyruvyl transferase family protein n=1 Tax=Microbacterium sp. A204 TaxID=3457321 RepID=UPI003FD352AF
MQRIFNYGSSLQAYALRRLLEQASVGADVSYVDYTPGEPLVKNASAGAASGLERVITKVREYGSIKASLRDKLRFFDHKRRYGANYYRLIGIRPEKNLATDVDLQVIGSDEVFNCVQSNVNVGFSLGLFGIGSKAHSVVSYAASFGNTTLTKIDKAGVRGDVVGGLENFAAISVRDENSAIIVAELLGIEAPPVHLDPTLVYDLMGGHDVPTQRLRDDKYMIVYGYSGRFSETENQSVRQYADRHGLRVLAFGGLQESADEFVDCSPFELLAYFRDAEAIVTDTFHGTIFSVINEVPFATIIRRSAGHGYGNEEKLGYLLRRLELDGRTLSSPERLEKLLQQPIDFTSVRAIREAEVARTRDYLRRVCYDAGVGSASR